jgi:hypothetical protein
MTAIFPASVSMTNAAPAAVGQTSVSALLSLGAWPP